MWENIRPRADQAFEYLTYSFVDMALPLLVALLVPAVIVRLVSFSESSSRLALVELSFFSVLGVLVAYLTNLSKDTVLQSLLPSLIVLLTFFFQLFGRTKADAHVPLGTKITFLSGTMTVVSFLVASRYFTLAFGST